MKTQAFLAYGSLLGLVCSLLGGCGERKHSLIQTTAHIGGDGETNRVVNVEFESSISLKGSKLDLKDLELNEEVGKDGWKYGVGVSSASSSPEAVYLPIIADMFKSSQFAQARQAEQRNDKVLVDLLNAIREDLAAARTNAPPVVEE